MKPFTIFVLLPSFATGGAEKVTLSLVQNLNHNIFNCYLVIQNSDGPLKNKFRSKNIINLNSSRFRYSLFGLIKKIYKKKPKVIFSTFPHITIFLLLIKKILFLDIILIAREPNMPSVSLANSPYSFIIRNLYNIFMPSIDGVIASSLVMKNELVEKGISKNKISIISNPISIEEVRNFKKTIRHKGNGVRLVYVGRLVYQKGLDRLLPFIKHVPNLHLIIIGEGKEKKHLKKIIKENKIANNIEFLGQVDMPYPYIAGADYLVLPSRWEGFPNVVLESLALGTPVITMKEIVGLQDLKSNIQDKSLILFEEVEEIVNFLLNTESRKDFLKPIIRPVLLKDYNTPVSYSKNVSNFISKIINE